MRSIRLILLTLLVALVATALKPAGEAAAKSPVRVGIADQSPRMFDDPAFKRAKIKRTRYFIPADIMRDKEERLKARTFVKAARAAKVSVLLHISTADLRSKRGKRVSTSRYRKDVGRIVAYFRRLGVRDFGAWNEVNHKTQETWNSPGHAVSYFKSMYRAVKLGAGPPKKCRSCAVVGLDVLDQKGVDKYIRDVYKRLSRTWRKRLTVVGIHNYSDVNRSRSTGTSRIIRTTRKYNKRTKFWFTETGALASFKRSFPYSEKRQAKRIKNMFKYANRYRRSGVGRVYSYNWFGIENGTSCGDNCLFDAGLVDADGTTRPAYDVFRKKLAGFSR